MTVNSVNISRAANRNTSTNVVRIPSSTASGSVQLKVAASDYANKTVYAGVPLPEGDIASTTEMCLKNSSGVEVPAQFDVLMNWPDGTIKSVLVTAAVQGSATEDVDYFLDYGGAVAPSAITTNLGYTDNGNEIVVSTGKIRVTLDKTSGAFIKSAFVDTAGDQTYSTQVLEGSNIWLQNAFDDVMFNSSSDSDIEWTVLRSGPIALQLRGVGYLRDSSSNQLTQYRLFLTFFRDSDLFELDYTLVDDEEQQEIEGSFDFGTDTVRFAARNYGIQLDHSISSNHQYIFGGEEFNETGPYSSEEYLYQYGEANFINGISTNTAGSTSEDGTGQIQSYSGVQQGNRAAGFFTAHNGTVGCSVIVRHFWQNWPNEFSLDTSNMKIHLHPERYIADSGGSPTTGYSVGPNGQFVRPNTLYHQKHGLAKTYKMKIILHSSTPVADDIRNIADDFHDWKLGFECTSQHYCDTKAFGDITPSDSDSSVHDTSILQNVLIVSQTNRLAEKIQPYGWRDFGDVYRQGSGSTGSLNTRAPQLKCGAHVGATNFYIMWLRTKEKAWLKEADRETLHFRDIDVIHCAMRDNWFDGDNPLNPEPPGAIGFVGHAMVDHESRRSYETHEHMSGLLENYMLTGDERSKEVLKERQGFLKHVVPGWYFTPRTPWRVFGYGFGFRKFSASERNYAWPLYGMNTCTKAFNDVDNHANYAGQMIRFLVEWWKDKGDHIINDVVVGYNDWEIGTGWWRMDDMDNGRGTGTNPWMASWLIHTILDWVELEEKYQTGAADVVEVRQMIYQCVNYVIKYGWDSVNKDFWYSESQKRNGDSGADKHMGSAAARAYIEYQKDLSEGNISNPEWFDLESWNDPISHYYDQTVNVPKGFYPPGFYGYEILWPQSGWKYFKDYTALYNA